MLPFLIVLFIAIFGFAMGLGIILYNNDGDFSSPLKAIISSFNYGTSAQRPCSPADRCE